jgi:hypothetical protein
MIGPLPTAPEGFNRVLVAIDKFTKWIEVKPVTCSKADNVLDFLNELVHHYGQPHRIITNLGSNFNNHQFWEYCETAGSTSGVGVLDRQTYQGGTQGSRLCGGDRDRETENSKVCARTRNTRFIHVRAAKVVSPTSCLGIKYGALRLVLG